jgi:hypothetical protein
MLAAPKVDALPLAKILADIEGREVVSLPELGARIGMGEQSRKYAIRAGLITPTAPVVNRREGYKITRDEAFTLLLAAALAVAAGVAIAVMLRGCKSAGLTGAAAASALRNMT